MQLYLFIYYLYFILDIILYFILDIILYFIYIIGASLSEPHTSVTAFVEVVCMYVCLCVCGHIP